ncbi:MAG: DNA repair protein RecN [Cytophagales bacterium]|nr:DNA repair protein RecN [Bernardetiaceae bacterium]MDW8204427.1 DNA repair protein RecN [Cytophagales bacterium]
MLKHLIIKNYVLIRQLAISPSEHLNIITGETGAGKSILLGAIGLLLGDRADSKTLSDAGEKCVVEGHFDVGQYQLQSLFEEADLDFDRHCTIRREISPTGKSRAFINDTPVTLEILRRIGSRLIDIHSQHDTLLLAADDFQRQLLDTFAQHQPLIQAYTQTYQQWRNAEQHLQKLLAQAETLRKEADYHQYLLAELQQLPLEEMQQEDMEQELERLENMEAINNQLALMMQLLAEDDNAAENTVRTALSEAKKIVGYSSHYQTIASRLESLFIELRDIVSEINSELNALFFDEERAYYLKTHLDKLYTLQKKHGVSTVNELIAIRNQLAEKLNLTHHLDEAIADARSALQAAQSAMQAAAAALSASRRAAAEPMAQQTNHLLGELGMPNARLEIRLHSIAPAAHGTDAVNFLFSANKGIRPEPLKNVASGGEFSRLMLCLKYILADKTALPTIIFDEIDTGISGEIAIKVSKMLRQMSKKHQLFVISHLPQTAANGEQHYYVYKDNTAERAVSCIRQLSYEERVSEIAQMIGGATPSETAYQSARELLAMYH